MEYQLFRTPTAIEAGGGARSPAMCKARNTTQRLAGQVIDAVNPGQLPYPEGVEQPEPLIRLLPTPVAQPSGNSPEVHLRKKPGRKVVTDLAILTEYGLLPTGGELPEKDDMDNYYAEQPLLPTPTAGLAISGQTSRSGARKGEKLLNGLAQEMTINWGPYEPAVRRWEGILGLPAPSPTLPDGREGKHRLNAAFAEWMMGLGPGHVTGEAIGLKRNQQLKAIGNGVVPQQCIVALSQMVTR